MYDPTLEALCAHFERELERQENILAQLIAQRAAITAHDSDALDLRTRALHLLLEEVVNVEPERHALLRQVVEKFALPVKRQTLTDLVQAAPEPYKHRLAEFQHAIKRTLTESRSIERANGRLLRRSMRFLNRVLHTADESFRPAASYTFSGGETLGIARGPVMVDQRG